MFMTDVITPSEALTQFQTDSENYIKSTLQQIPIANSRF